MRIQEVPHAEVQTIDQTLLLEIREDRYALPGYRLQ